MTDAKKRFSFRSRVKSFGYALRGIFDFFSGEHNARVHLFAAVAVIGVGFWLSISVTQWMVVILLIGVVFMAELFNTAIEKLCDLVISDFNPKIKKIKDLSAAAVFVAAITAAIIGLIIFVPSFINK